MVTGPKDTQNRRGPGWTLVWQCVETGDKGTSTPGNHVRFKDAASKGRLLSGTGVYKGGTAKATFALGAFPYVALMPRLTTPLRLNMTNIAHFNLNAKLPSSHFGTENAFSSCDSVSMTAGMCWEVTALTRA